jgi:hypothetical protein
MTPTALVVHPRPGKMKKRNAGGGVLGEKGNPLVPILGGVAGGVATVYGAEKFGLSPVAAAGIGVAAGLGIGSATKTPWMKQAAMGVAIGAGTLGGMQLLAQVRSNSANASKAPPAHAGKRQAEGDGFVTRTELNDALSKLAETHKEDLKEQQKQQTCDLLTALRTEIKQVVTETMKAQEPPKQPGGVPRIYPLYPTRGATVEDERNAFVEDEYMRNAYATDDERNAIADEEYARNAYADEGGRNAYADEERNAVADDERNAYVEDERNAYVEEVPAAA